MRGRCWRRRRGLLHQAACALTPEQVEVPIAPGKWSVREVVAHLADCELVFSFRLRQTLAEEAPVIQPFGPRPLGEALRGLRSAFRAGAVPGCARVEPEADRRG